MVRNRAASGWYFLDSFRYDDRMVDLLAFLSSLSVLYGSMIWPSAVRKSSMRKFFSFDLTWSAVVVVVDDVDDVAVVAVVDDVDDEVNTNLPS